MNVKKAVKRIAALATGATMVTATIVGAMAYDLSDYPQPFVEDGMFNGNIVIGKTAKVADVYGAIDIAASLQAAAKSPVDADGTSQTVTVSGGTQIETGSDDFNLGDDLANFEDEYDDEHFPELLADGVVEDDGGDEYDYEQTISLGSATLKYDQNDDYGDEPVFHLDVSGGTTMTYRVEFDNSIDVSDNGDNALDDSETIEMFGKEYTFDPDNDAGEDFILYGADQTVTVTQEEPVTVQSEGEEYEIEVLGGNTGDSSAIIRVSGDGTETKTLESGDSQNMAGLELFVDDVFISDIGEDTISVSIFVGSNKLVIPDSSTSFEEIEINNEDETDIDGKVLDTSGVLDDFQGFEFRVDLTNFDNSETGDEWEWLQMGQSFEDPLFGFDLAFEGMTPSVDSRQPVELSRSGDTYNLMFETNGGDEIDIPLIEAPTDTTVQTGDGGLLKLGQSSFAEDDYFILEDSEPRVQDRETYVFELSDLDLDNSEFTLKNIGDGSDETYEDGDEIEDTGVYGWVDGGNLNLRNSTNGTAIPSKSRFIADGGLQMDFGLNGSTYGQMNLTEDSDDLDEVGAADTVSVDFNPDSNDDIIMSSASWSGGYEATDSDGDYKYGISDYGTWFDQERDNNGDYLKVYYGEEETDFNVFLNGPDAVVTTSGSSSGDAYQLNEIGVGLAVYDEDAMSLIGDTPLLAVGGPCVNTVAMDLMGNPEVCSEGFEEGKAKIKLFESKNAVLVAGYSGEDTTGAARVLANYDKYDLSGDEVEVITTDLQNLEVNAVE